ncbi:MAG TPA: MFS transporter [Vicinamibacterales bacterium]|nr:MFS transporter [Vicinamibacterales bacterium]
MRWRRNLYAVTAATFIGFTGFTLVMPFLPLYFEQLGLTDVGEIALWSGLSLGATPAITALMAPFWGRLADRYGRKIMVQRSLFSFVLVMGAMAYVTEPWHVFALRVFQGLFAGYGALALTMAADSAPREQTAYAIGVVQTAQRLGPALGPVIGGVVAQAVGLRNAFFVTSAFYLLAFVLVAVMYDEQGVVARVGRDEPARRVTFRNVLAFENFVLLMAVIFGLQFVDRSFGPVLPLFVGELGAPGSQVPLLAGIIFSTAAGAGALGNQFCGRLMARLPARRVIAGACAAASGGVAGYLLAANPWWLMLPTFVFGVAIGMATTAAYTAASSVIPGTARGTGFGLLTTASLVGLAVSPIANGILATTSIRAVFVVDAIILAALALMVSRLMITAPLTPATSPPTEEI